MHRCEFCKKSFVPDRRTRQRQKCCQSPKCLALAKQRRQKRWSSKKKNRDYFRGRVHVDRMDRWRAAHPNYQRHANARRRRRGVLQDAVHTQVRILHEIFAGSEAVVLQDTVAPRMRSLLQLGHIMFAGDTDEGRGAAAAPSAVSACDPPRTTGILFVDSYNLPGVSIQEQTVRCAGALLKVRQR